MAVGAPLPEKNLGTIATRAVVCAGIGIVVFAPVGLLGWVYGRRVLRGIATSDLGHEHRAAGQVGVVGGWVSLFWLLVTSYRLLADLG